jgi:hypothetical protein
MLRTIGITVILLTLGSGSLPAPPGNTTDVTFTGEGLPCPTEPCDQLGGTSSRILTSTATS